MANTTITPSMIYGVAMMRDEAHLRFITERPQEQKGKTRHVKVKVYDIITDEQVGLVRDLPSGFPEKLVVTRSLWEGYSDHEIVQAYKELEE